MLLPKEVNTGLIAHYVLPSEAGLLYEQAKEPYSIRLIDVQLLGESRLPGAGHQFLCRTLDAAMVGGYGGTAIYVGAHHTSTFRLIGFSTHLDLKALGVVTAGDVPDQLKPEVDALRRLKLALTCASIAEGLLCPTYEAMDFPHPEQLTITLEVHEPSSTLAQRLHP